MPTRTGKIFNLTSELQEDTQTTTGEQRNIQVETGTTHTSIQVGAAHFYTSLRLYAPTFHFPPLSTLSVVASKIESTSSPAKNIHLARNSSAAITVSISKTPGAPKKVKMFRNTVLPHLIFSEKNYN